MAIVVKKPPAPPPEVQPAQGPPITPGPPARDAVGNKVTTNKLVRLSVGYW